MPAKKKRKMSNVGICPVCQSKMKLIWDNKKNFFGRRCRMYICQCGREFPFWTPSFRIEKGEYEYES